MAFFLQYNGYITGSKYDRNWVRHCRLLYESYQAKISLKHDGEIVRYDTIINKKINEKNGKYGFFWGCSNYPKYIYTKSATTM